MNRAEIADRLGVIDRTIFAPLVDGVCEIVSEAERKERLRNAAVCRELAERHKRDVGGECDDSCDIVSAFHACADEIMAGAGR